MTKVKEEKVITKTPSGFSVVAREFKKDKGAFAALITLSAILIFVVLFNIYIRVSGVYSTYFDVDLLNIFLKPGEDGFLLGTDVGGHSVFGWLMMGMLNSILIAVAVTAITIGFGTAVGLVIAYYGGRVDNIVMRFVDFMVIIPTLMVIIVFVSIKRDYGLVLFILILSAFAESRRDYVLASKTMGTPDWKIMLQGILPNISSIIIVEATLSLAANMGIEVGLTYLGFGLPAGTPSIGTMLSYAKDADVLINKMYIWLPAALAILIIVLCINSIGGALRRSLDARQRL